MSPERAGLEAQSRLSRKLKALKRAEATPQQAAARERRRAAAGGFMLVGPTSNGIHMPNPRALFMRGDSRCAISFLDRGPKKKGYRLVRCILLGYRK